MNTTPTDRTNLFRSLHTQSRAFVIANAWDAGSARLLADLGFAAIATSSGAFAGTLGRRDGRVTREEALSHARAIVDAAELPVSADLEKGFADAPAEVAATIRLAAATGLAGGSIEDSTVCSALTKPVNFMVGIKGCSFSVAELEAAGVRRISLATSLYRAAMTGLLDAAREVHDQGTFGFLDRIMNSAQLNGYMRV